MKISVVLAILISLLPVSWVMGQSTDTAKVVNSYDELKAKQKQLGIDTLYYGDITYSYRVQIPQWLKLIETGNSSLFGGTLPAVDGIENAVMVMGFPKSEFKSFDEFKDIYLTGNRFGEVTKYSKEHVWYGQNDLIKIEHGVKRKVFTIWQKLIYYNMFVLLETKTAYLWIQFTASPDTYDKNIGKFEEFMAGLKVFN